MKTTVYHDGFARQSLMREVDHTSRECDWCGQNLRGHLFRYGTQQDDSLSGFVDWARGLFCSVGCFRSYHN